MEKNNYKKISDAVQLGKWEEVENLSLETITKRKEDENKNLNGLIVRGYEMKWGKDNGNGETYEKGAFDKFIKSYFVDNKLNMPVTIQHSQDWEALCGRVIYIETNSVGFYFVVYIPKTYIHYNEVKALIVEGILQGFSKEGWATDVSDRFDKDGNWIGWKINEMEILNVSLVATPANYLRFEKAGEIKNELVYRNNLQQEEKQDGGAFRKLFRK